VIKKWRKGQPRKFGRERFKVTKFDANAKILHICIIGDDISMKSTNVKLTSTMFAI
jgi:hypothetical protein